MSTAATRWSEKLNPDQVHGWRNKARLLEDLAFSSPLSALLVLSSYHSRSWDQLQPTKIWARLLKFKRSPSPSLPSFLPSASFFYSLSFGTPRNSINEGLPSARRPPNAEKRTRWLFMLDQQIQSGLGRLGLRCHCHMMPSLTYLHLIGITSSKHFKA